MPNEKIYRCTIPGCGGELELCSQTLGELVLGGYTPSFKYFTCLKCGVLLNVGIVGKIQGEEEELKISVRGC